MVSGFAEQVRRAIARKDWPWSPPLSHAVPIVSVQSHAESRSAESSPVPFFANANMRIGIAGDRGRNLAQAVNREARPPRKLTTTKTA